LAAKHAYLNPTESQTLVDFIKEIADQGYPLSYKKIAEYALAIIHIHNKSIDHLGKYWADCFVRRHEEEIGAKTCSLLEKTCAQALNPANVKSHYELLQSAIEDYSILLKNIYNCDETGCPLNVPLQQKVVVSTKNKQACATSSASKEHIMVLEFICADGTALQLVVIFPGKAFLEKWKQVNPLKAKYVPNGARNATTNLTTGMLTPKRDG